MFSLNPTPVAPITLNTPVFPSFFDIQVKKKEAVSRKKKYQEAKAKETISAGYKENKNSYANNGLHHSVCTEDQEGFLESMVDSFLESIGESRRERGDLYAVMAIRLNSEDFDY